MRKRVNHPMLLLQIKKALTQQNKKINKIKKNQIKKNNKK